MSWFWSWFDWNQPPWKTEKHRPKFLADYTPIQGIGREPQQKFGAVAWSKRELGVATGRLDELLNLFPGDEDFAEGRAGLQEATPDQTAHGFGTAIEGLGRLLDVIQEGFNRGSLGHFRGGDFGNIHSSFLLVCFTP